VSNA
jgi:hypothetical protein